MNRTTPEKKYVPILMADDGRETEHALTWTEANILHNQKELIYLWQDRCTETRTIYRPWSDSWFGENDWRPAVQEATCNH